MIRIGCHELLGGGRMVGQSVHLKEIRGTPGAFGSSPPWPPLRTFYEADRRRLTGPLLRSFRWKARAVARHDELNLARSDADDFTIKRRTTTGRRLRHGPIEIAKNRVVLCGYSRPKVRILPSWIKSTD